MFKDSISLTGVITKCSHTLKKRLMIYISSVMEGYERNELRDVGFVKSKDNPPDPFIKIVSSDTLDHILLTGKCNHPVQH